MHEILDGRRQTLLVTHDGLSMRCSSQEIVDPARARNLTTVIACGTDSRAIRKGTINVAL